MSAQEETEYAPKDGELEHDKFECCSGDLDDEYVEMLEKPSYGRTTAVFMSGSTAHGLGRVFSRQGGWARSTAWLLLWMFGVGVFVYIFYHRLTTFLEYNTTTSITVEHAKKLTFPSITLCNENPGDLYKSIDFMWFTGGAYEFGNTAGYNADYRIYIEELNRYEINNISVPQTDFLVECLFSTETCDVASNFSAWYDPTFGRCYTFNGGLVAAASNQDASSFQLLESERTGIRHGFQVIMYINQSSYLFQSATAGVRVDIHDQFAPPNPTAGITLMPGTHTIVAAQRQEFQEIGDPYTNCHYSPRPVYDQNTDWSQYGNILDMRVGASPLYSVAGCVSGCKTDVIIKQCNCMDPAAPLESWVDGLPSCVNNNNLTQEFIDFSCFLTVSAEFSEGRYECNCPNRCNRVSYETTVSQSEWPATGNAWQLYEALNNKTQFTGIDATEINENFVLLSVFYQELNQQKLVTTAQYELAQFGAEMGGWAGLLLGISFLTVCEFFEYFYWLCLTCSRKQEKGKQRKMRKQTRDTFVDKDEHPGVVVGDDLKVSTARSAERSDSEVGLEHTDVVVEEPAPPSSRDLARTTLPGAWQSPSSSTQQQQQYQPQQQARTGGRAGDDAGQITRSAASPHTQSGISPHVRRSQPARTTATLHMEPSPSASRQELPASQPYDSPRKPVARPTRMQQQPSGSSAGHSANAQSSHHPSTGRQPGSGQRLYNPQTTTRRQEGPYQQRYTQPQQPSQPRTMQPQAARHRSPQRRGPAPMASRGPAPVAMSPLHSRRRQQPHPTGPVSMNPLHRGRRRAQGPRS